MPLISVIVPVYKVEKYIQRCVDSILSQTFDSFDLILVDDGSPDECGAICDAYAEKDDRVTVIHQTNQGQAEARNVGIEWAIKNSDSEWISFIDSDDWIHKDYFKLLYETATKNNVDLSICNCLKTSDMTVDLFEPNKDVKLFSPEEFWCFRQYGGPHAKLFKKFHFKEIRFPKGIIYEDVFVIYRLIFMQKKQIAYIEDPLYFYYIRSDSTTNSSWRPAVMSQTVGMKQQLKFFKKNRFNKAFAVSARNMLYGIKDQYESVKPLKKKYFKEYLKLKIMNKYNLIKYHKYVPIRKNTNLYRSALPLITTLYKKFTYITETKIE